MPRVSYSQTFHYVPMWINCRDIVYALLDLSAPNRMQTCPVELPMSLDGIGSVEFLHPDPVDFLAKWTQNACGDGALWELMWRTFYTRCHQWSTHFHHKTSINVLCWRVLLTHDLGDYNIIVQVVDSKKQFSKLFVGLLGSVTNSKILRRSTLYKHAQY